MSKLKKILTNIITNKTDVCCLCFNAGAQMLNIHDEVTFNFNGTQNNETFIKILSVVLDDQILDGETLVSICANCAKTAINSYKFIKMCRENYEQLCDALDILNESFDTPNNDADDDIDTFKSLIVTVDVINLTSKQYYDQKIAHTPNAALIKLKSLSKQKQGKKETKGKRRNNKDSELIEICDVIRKKKCPTQYKCKGCSNTFIKLFNFKKHYYSQHSPKVVKCSECPRSYGSEALLKQHKYDCHSNLICSECGKAYKNRYSLLYHMRQHSGEQPYICKFCGQKFQWSSRRAEHIRRFHMEPKVECDICHIKLRALGSLYEHRKRHFNPNSRLHVIQTIETVEARHTQPEKPVKEELKKT